MCKCAVSLRVPLVNETKEVRAAGYRALRYLVRLPEDVRSVIRFQVGWVGPRPGVTSDGGM